MSVFDGIGWVNRREQMYEVMRVNYCEAWVWRLRGDKPWRYPPTLIEQLLPQSSERWMDAFAELVGV